MYIYKHTILIQKLIDGLWAKSTYFLTDWLPVPSVTLLSSDYFFLSFLPTIYIILVWSLDK